MIPISCLWPSFTCLGSSRHTSPPRLPFWDEIKLIARSRGGPGGRGVTEGGRARRPPYSRGAACRSRDTRAFPRDAINTTKDNKPFGKPDRNYCILTLNITIQVRISSIRNSYSIPSCQHQHHITWPPSET